MSRNTIVALVVVAALAAWWFYAQQEQKQQQEAQAAAARAAGGANPQPSGGTAGKVVRAGVNVIPAVWAYKVSTKAYDTVTGWF